MSKRPCLVLALGVAQGFENQTRGYCGVSVFTVYVLFLYSFPQAAAAYCSPFSFPLEGCEPMHLK